MIDLKSTLAVSNDVEEEKDILGGRSFILESGVYPMIIDMAYLKISDGGSFMLMVNFKDRESGTMFNGRMVMTSGTAKGVKNFYLDKTGKKRLLPGMAQAKQLAEICTGKSIDEMVPEEKFIQLYSFSEKKEVPTKVPVYMDLIGCNLKVGVLKEESNKNVQVDGAWIPTTDKQEKNEIGKLFTEEGKTLTEHNAGEPAEFISRWSAQNEGKVIDKYKPVQGAPAASAGPAPVIGSGTPLFT